MDSPEHNTISGNSIIDTEYGIYLSESPNNVISLNTIINNGWGIFLDETQNNSIVGNTITNNGEGLTLWYASNNNISRNTITSIYRGIQLGYSSDNFIYGNNISGNWIGILIQESSGNRFYHNKKPKTYTLLYPLEDVEEKISVISLKSKINDYLHDNMEKEALEWLQNLSLKPTPTDKHTFFEEKTEVGIRIDETEAHSNQEKAYASAEAGFNNPIPRLSQPSLDEISLKNRENEELTILRMDSDGWNPGGWFKWKRVKPSSPCELCGEQPTEYLIHIQEWGTTLQRCETCFNNFRKSFRGIP